MAGTAISVPLNIRSRPVRGHCDFDFCAVLAFRTVFSPEATMDAKNRFLFVAVLLCLTWTGSQAEVELTGCTTDIKNTDLVARVDVNCDQDKISTVIELMKNVTEKVKAIIRTLGPSGNEQSRMEQSSDCVMNDISEGGLAGDLSPVFPCDDGVSWMEGENVINGASVNAVCDNSPSGDNILEMTVLMGDVECFVVNCDYNKY